MKTMLLDFGPWAVLFVLVFLFVFLVHKRFKDRNVWARIVNRYRENSDARILTEAAFVTRFGTIENNSLVYKMDRLMLTSGVKDYLPWANGETFLAAMAVLALAGLVEGAVIFHNLFATLFLAAAQAVFLYALVKALAAKTYNTIEDGTAVFVTILANHAKGSSDIVTIMEKTATSLTGPLRSIIEKFVLDCERTGNADVAFDYLKESIDNRQLQTIFMNLKNCMHYQANYEEVIMQIENQLMTGLAAREDRKNVLFSMKLTLAVISITAVVIVLLIGTGLGIDVKGIMTENAIGQALLCITGFLYLFVLLKMFGTDR